MVAEKCWTWQTKKHAQIAEVTILEVVQLMRGFVSKGLVKEQFAWRHYYWFLTNEGIEFLRDFLHLPATIVPATLKKSQRFAKPMERRPNTRGGFRGRSDRDEYRADGDKKTQPPVEFSEGNEETQAPATEEGDRSGAPSRGGFRGRGRGGFRGGRGFSRGGRGGRPQQE